MAPVIYNVVDNGFFNITRRGIYMKKKKQLEDEVLLTTAEVASILNISRTLVCRHIKRKNIPYSLDKNESLIHYLLTPDAVKSLIMQLSRTKQKSRLERLEDYLAHGRLIYRSMIDENFDE